MFVSSSNVLGPGKAVAQDGEDLVLEYFDTPGQAPEDRLRLSVPRTGLRRFPLKPETRVFWMVKTPYGEGWRSGRIIEVSAERDVLVRGHEMEHHVPETRLYVRYDFPVTDPVGFAAGGMLESPLLADLRRPFLRAILQQRFAARGMSGALSGAVSLHDHQLRTAWRVLQDPIQRYLLADEVGLGKTIEAGMILRQLLLHDPTLSAQLILPPFLIGQWKQELETKFFTTDFTRAAIRYSRNDDPEDWGAADLLIVDEAHHLTALADSARPELRARFRVLAETAAASPRLLLLSATPALDNESSFLHMLRLLDPAIWTKRTRKDLRGLLTGRAELGRIFLGLQPDLPATLLRGGFAQLRGKIDIGDSDAHALLDHADAALTEADPGAVGAAIAGLRAHVSEIHKVHRRMLRTRRTAALATDYRVTGRTRPEPLRIPTELFAVTTRLLEAWRQEALAVVESDPAGIEATAEAFAEAVSLGPDPEAVAAWAAHRMGRHPHEATSLGRIRDDLALIDMRDVLVGQVADALSYAIRPRQRVVVFCPTGKFATCLAEKLRTFLPAGEVLEHLSTHATETVDAVIRRFEDSTKTAVLVADSSAEEGRNFQFADLLLHVGAPTAANQMEQRIGRLDRWQLGADGAPWTSLFLAAEDDHASFHAAWQRILDEGFGVFDQSIASLQFVTEAASAETWRRLFVDGIEATDAVIESVRHRLAEELVKIREQDALDDLDTQPGAVADFGALFDLESREGEFAETSDRLLRHLNFQVLGNPVRGEGTYDVFTRLPGRQLQIPLIPLGRIERDFLSLRGQRATYRREVALRQKQTHLCRYGDPFVEAVSDFLWHDDRGRAFGMWRWLPAWGYADRVAYRFDYAVEARVAATEDAALRHRADALFPPIIATVWVGPDGAHITDADTLDLLAGPYAKPEPGTEGGDFALNLQRIPAAYRLVPRAEWPARWRGAEATARRLVLDLHEVRDAVRAAVQAAQSDTALRERQLTVRAARTAGVEQASLAREAKSERAVGATLLAAVARPELRLDCTGIVILSGAEPRTGGEG